mmetsp:Transcript_24194/g.78846  ORF Transcript_24194/g.78846 Transcript_24194/m.78846 type:complete len:718 (-) Transcript_24194:974-3127(-)
MSSTPPQAPETTTSDGVAVSALPGAGVPEAGDAPAAAASAPPPLATATVVLKVRVLAASAASRSEYVEHRVRTSPTTTVGEFKSVLEGLSGIPQRQQRLLFRGRVLTDAQTIVDIDARDEAVLHLVARPPEVTDTNNDVPPPLRQPGPSRGPAETLPTMQLANLLGSLGEFPGAQVDLEFVFGSVGQPLELLERFAGALDSSVRRPSRLNEARPAASGDGSAEAASAPSPSNVGTPTAAAASSSAAAAAAAAVQPPAPPVAEATMTSSPQQPTTPLPTPEMRAPDAPPESQPPPLRPRNAFVVEHHGVQCDGCNALPIVGRRHKSLINDDFDLCDRCFAAGMGREAQPFTCISLPLPTPSASMPLPPPPGSTPAATAPAAAARATAPSTSGSSTARPTATAAETTAAPAGAAPAESPRHWEAAGRLLHRLEGVTHQVAEMLRGSGDVLRDEQQLTEQARMQGQEQLLQLSSASYSLAALLLEISRLTAQVHLRSTPGTGAFHPPRLAYISREGTQPNIPGQSLFSGLVPPPRGSMGRGPQPGLNRVAARGSGPAGVFGQRQQDSAARANQPSTAAEREPNGAGPAAPGGVGAGAGAAGAVPRPPLSSIRTVRAAGSFPGAMGIAPGPPPGVVPAVPPGMGTSPQTFLPNPSLPNNFSISFTTGTGDSAAPLFAAHSGMATNAGNQQGPQPSQNGQQQPPPPLPPPVRRWRSLQHPRR